MLQCCKQQFVVRLLQSGLRWCVGAKIATPTSQNCAVGLFVNLPLRAREILQDNICIFTQRPTVLALDGTWRTWNACINNLHVVLYVLCGAFGASADLDLSYCQLKLIHPKIEFAAGWTFTESPIRFLGSIPLV